MDAARTGESTSRVLCIQRLLDECIAGRLAGQGQPDEVIIAAHPDLMPELAGELRNLAVIERARRRAGQDHASAAADTVQGDSRFTRLAKPDFFPGYELVGEIHRGGQGVVYRAVQRSTNRHVAIKITREGSFSGPRELARFEREVQILGLLKHPNIVAIHDSGIAAAGSVYYVMDYISGRSLDQWMDKHSREGLPARGEAAVRSAGDQATKPSGADGATLRSAIRDPKSHLRETLCLFHKICEAVNAAHLRGIIHRDLKPSNIRIDTADEPHVLDFGLAKMTAETDAALMTMTGEFVGSLPWASPEQAEGAAGKVDVRTDVYSLGVLLYQMLTGKFPYDVSGNMRDVLDRIMRAEPARPSTIRRHINDELETIVLKCLAKEREQRYQIAGELSRDIRNYLSGEPITARPPSLAYQMRVFARRNKGKAAAAIAVMASLILGIFGTTWQAVRASEAEQRAIDQRDAVVRANDFYEQCIGGMNPYPWNRFQWRRAPAADARVTDLLKVAVENIDQAFPDRPELEVQVRRTIGQALFSAGMQDVGLAQLRASHERALRTLDSLDHNRLDTARALGGRLLDMQQLHYRREAVTLLEEYLETARAAFGTLSIRSVDAHMILAMAYAWAQRPMDAEPVAREGLRLARQLGSPADALLVPLSSGLGSSLYMQRRWEEAVQVLRQVLDGPAAASANLADISEATAILAEALLMLGRFDEATTAYETCVNDSRTVFGARNLITMHRGMCCAFAMARSGDLQSAESFAREFFEIPDGDRTSLPGIQASVHLAWILANCGKLEEAAPLAAAAMQAAMQAPDDSAAFDLRAHAGATMGCILRLIGRDSEADALGRALIEAGVKAGVPLRQGKHTYPSAWLSAARAFAERGMFEEAEYWLLDAYEHFRRASENAIESKNVIACELVDVYSRWRKPELAATWQALCVR